MKEVQEDKNSVRFKFNAYNQYDDNYELQIHKAHLEQKLNHKILNQNALKKLKIEENLQCIQLGFGVNYWEIELKWKSGNVILGEGWNHFLRAAELTEGDICIIQNIGAVNKFQVAVFHKTEMSKWISYQGEDDYKCKSKFFKLVDKEALERSEIHFPRVFMEKYGQNLNDIV
ncbi:hypothetical protein POM88_006491 [Heracleum sosnowskyi]|uniref:TF-B3 domain-containing protein n=1 Tax=Heracleum sosnowskyi TaxID=360622 RepID=A0AAD8J4Y4_9APIA|nr:hypothetical protein POM88_006491 [Heracleum sosnowskyi]